MTMIGMNKSVLTIEVVYENVFDDGMVDYLEFGDGSLSDELVGTAQWSAIEAGSSVIGRDQQQDQERR